MKKIIGLLALLICCIQGNAQIVLSLDSCRAMALQNNKQLNATKLKQDVAHNTRKAMRTKYLPKVDALGGYEHFSKEVSLLNNDQKTSFSNLGTGVATTLGGNITNTITGMVQKGIMSPEAAQQMGALFSEITTPIAQAGNAVGQSVVDALKTDTRNIWSGAIMVRQPLYMGGAIMAANKMADIAEEMAATEVEGMLQQTVYKIDETYWLVVSLKQKKKLADSYCDLVKKLNEDVHKLINEGIATRADGLKVDVKVNEAEMVVTQVDNGLSLAKMLLCQLCGLDVNTDIVLADEDNVIIATTDETANLSDDIAQENRSELKLLQNAVDLSKQTTKLLRAEYLPHVALTGGYLISNPNVFNGFQNKFSGVWNVGVVVQMPVWNWFEGAYKVRASKAATSIALMEKNDAEEKINLQVAQCRFKMNEANKRLNMAVKNLTNAEENLRCANVGFREGVMETTEVMAAQTAWQAAQTQKIDAEIDVKLSQVNLKKALGILQ